MFKDEWIIFSPDKKISVRPIAPLPQKLLDALWGEEYRGAPLDTPDALTDAKALLRRFPQEKDKPKSAAYIASLTREWRAEEKGEERIREKIEELENYAPEYDTTRRLAGKLLNCGLSKVRATRLTFLWNQKNNPPLAPETVRQIIASVWEHPEFSEMPLSQRCRYRDASAVADGSLESFLDGETAADDFLMGASLSTDQRAMLYGPSGRGKTVFALAIAIHVAAGKDFLHWKGCGKPRRVLYIDGEVGKNGMQFRLKEAVQRLGTRPPKGMLTLITKEQFPKLRLGLDTPEGQLWLDEHIENAGGFDLIVFDNINTLCVKNTIGTEGWKVVDDWSLDLKTMGVGQLWVHHTGHDTSHEFGTVTRRNDMDTVIKLRPLPSTAERRSFAIEFDKARFADRAPADFEKVQINLAADGWSSSGGRSPTADRVEMLRAVLAEHNIIGEEQGLAHAAFAKLQSDDPAEQDRERERLKTACRREAYAALGGKGREGWRWFLSAADED